MRVLRHLFENNRNWAEQVRQSDPPFFQRLSEQHSPSYLWIGCSDSRVPANQIVGLLPGELFVHRNVANVVGHTDLNCLTVLQFAVDVLKVKHVIICGHYGCSGVGAALRGDRLGLADNWLRAVRDVAAKHADSLNAAGNESRRYDLLCELNVIEQVRHVCQSPIVTDAWERGQELTVHGWIYALRDGLLRDLDVCVSRAHEAAAICEAATRAKCGPERPATQ